MDLSKSLSSSGIRKEFDHIFDKNEEQLDDELFESSSRLKQKEKGLCGFNKYFNHSFAYQCYLESSADKEK